MLFLQHTFPPQLILNHLKPKCSKYILWKLSTTANRLVQFEVLQSHTYSHLLTFPACKPEIGISLESKVSIESWFGRQTQVVVPQSYTFHCFGSPGEVPHLFFLESSAYLVVCFLILFTILIDADQTPGQYERSQQIDKCLWYIPQYCRIYE